MKPLVPTTKMNQTETAWAQNLEYGKQCGEIIDYLFEPMRLILADRTTYTPDFLVVYPTHFEFHEVKGFWRDDARVKVKVAAKYFPWFQFRAIQYKNKKWEIEAI